MCVFNNRKIEIHNNKKKGLTKSLKPIEKTPFKKRRREEKKKRAGKRYKKYSKKIHPFLPKEKTPKGCFGFLFSYLLPLIPPDPKGVRCQPSYPSYPFTACGVRRRGMSPPDHTLFTLKGRRRPRRGEGVRCQPSYP